MVKVKKPPGKSTNKSLPVVSLADKTPESKFRAGLNVDFIVSHSPKKGTDMVASDLALSWAFVVVVIDDTKTQQKSLESLKDCHSSALLVAKGESGPLEKLEERPDVVLMRLHIGQDAHSQQMVFPAGIVYALSAASMGIRTVVVTEDTCNDDESRPSNVLFTKDFIDGFEKRNTGFKVGFGHHGCVSFVNASKCCKKTDDGTVVDWIAAMEHSNLFPELGGE